MELQVGVKILLKNKEGKYLLLQRDPKKYPDMRASWDIVGGRIEPGTPLPENLKREIKEETGLDYSGQPKLVAAQDIIKNNNRHVVRLTYTGEIEGNLKLSDEHLEGGWMTTEEVKQINPDLLDSYFRELIEAGKINL